jgi:hypothetical protein
MLIATLVLLPLLPNPPPVVAPPPDPLGIHLGLGANWSITGSFVTPAGNGIGSVPVTIVDYPCATYPNSAAGVASCRTVARGSTSAGGAFNLSVPTGAHAYYLFTNRTTDWGGTGRFFTDSSGNLDLGTLRAPPFDPYGNTTIVLPGYVTLATYFTSTNLNVQVPLLSWTADGAFYVNQSMRLVFYNFVTKQVTLIADWLPLYENVCSYACIENSEAITEDGSFVYELGCLTSCRSASNLTFYGVNVTTGATYEWNWTGLDDGQTISNVQINMIGRSGSYGVATLISSGGVMRGWSLANRTQWTLGTVAYFEANNLYWVPALGSWFDIAADASTSDLITQYEFNGTSITKAAQFAWGSSLQSNFVSGIDYNITGHELYFTAGYCGEDKVVTPVVSIGDGGVMSSVSQPSVDGCGFARTLPQTGTGTPVGSSEKRIGVDAYGLFAAGAWNDTFYNDSWVLDPTTGTWYAVNVSQEWPTGGGALQQSYDEEGFFYNGSYSIAEGSTECYHQGPSCPIEMNPGTVYYNWRLGLPEFPFPSTSPIAEPLAPARPVAGPIGVGSTYVNVSWVQPSGSEYPLLNYTVYWGPSAAYGCSASLRPTERSLNITGLTNGTKYYVQIVALNHHWFSPSLDLSFTTGTQPSTSSNLSGPQDLRLVGASATTADLAWTLPTTYGVTNVTIYYRPGDCPLAPFLWSFEASTGIADSTTVLSDLYDNATYCLAVSDWNGTRQSAPSNYLTTVLGHDYEVTFDESGLPSGSAWAALLNNVSQGSASPSISFERPNGTYRYVIEPVAEYASTPTTGFVTVAGSNATVSVTFKLEPTYPVIFVAAGLPTGSSWTIEINGTVLGSISATIVSNEPNGSYPYTVGAVPGYTETPDSGIVGVNGSNQCIPVDFDPTPSTEYSVTWTETGLAIGTNWSVTLGGRSVRSSQDSLVFAEPNGTYSFSVGTLAGFLASPASGTVTVTGADASQTIAFAPAPPPTFAVTFVENGLPQGAAWSVTLNGLTGTGIATIEFSGIANGTSSFTVGPENGYSAAPPGGSVAIRGGDAIVAISFTINPSAGSTVTFMETGLQSGALWSVAVDGLPASGSGPLEFRGVVNATHTFTVAPVAGYSASPSAGWIMVDGNTVETISFTPAPSTPSLQHQARTATLLGLPLNEALLLVVTICVGGTATMMGVMVVWRARRGGAPERGTATLPPPASTDRPPSR